MMQTLRFTEAYIVVHKAYKEHRYCTL